MYHIILCYLAGTSYIDYYGGNIDHNNHKMPRNHPYITSAKGLDGSKKWPVLITFSTDFKLTKCAVGGSESVQDYADVICGWSLKDYMACQAT